MHINLNKDPLSRIKSVAIILAGGHATRLRPLSNHYSKAMIPIANVPLISYTLKSIENSSITDIIISAGRRNHDLMNFLKKMPEKKGIQIHWHKEETPLGTGGALKSIIVEYELVHSFLVVNGDILFTLPFDDIERRREEKGADVSLGVVWTTETQDFGLVEADKDGRIYKFIEKPKDNKPGWINAGIFSVKPNFILSNSLNKDKFSFEKDILEPSVINKKNIIIETHINDKKWTDIGTIKRYIEANFNILKDIGQKNIIDKTSKIDKTSMIGERVIIGKHTKINKNSYIKNCIILPYSKIKKYETINGPSIVKPKSWKKITKDNNIEQTKNIITLKTKRIEQNKHMNEKLSIAITGGGTGGHTMISKIIADELKRNDHDVFWVGSANGLENKIARPSFPFYTIKTGPWHRSKRILNIWSLAYVFIGCLQAIHIFLKKRPHVLFSSGGYVAVPAILAARILRIPLVVHEQTMVMGLANRLGARWAQKVLCGFPPEKRTYIHTGTPIRPSIYEGEKEKAYEKYSLNANYPTILITGGSQGSMALNKVVIDTLPNILDSYNIVHQHGHNKHEQVKINPISFNGAYVPLPFVDENSWHHILAAASLVISRSGAGIVNELASLNKPAIFIPFPWSASCEQDKNALWMVENKQSIVINQKDLSPQSLYNAIEGMIEKEITEYEKIKKNKKEENSSKIQKIISNIINAAKYN